jgi:membrane protein implicated in regulation of membrane protease activity
MCERTRLETATKWVGYHLLELAAVIGSLVAAAELTWWLALLTAAIVALWGAQEWRAYRKRAQLRIRARRHHTLGGDTREDRAAVRVLPREGA